MSWAGLYFQLTAESFSEDQAQQILEEKVKQLDEWDMAVLCVHYQLQLDDDAAHHERLAKVREWEYWYRRNNLVRARRWLAYRVPGTYHYKKEQEFEVRRTLRALWPLLLRDASALSEEQREEIRAAAEVLSSALKRAIALLVEVSKEVS